MSVVKRLTAPLRAYFNPRFEAVVGRLDAIDVRLDRLEKGGGAPGEPALLERIDVGENDARFGAAPFASFTSMAVDAAHFREEPFREWFALVSDGGMEFHRKPWEYAFVLERARRGGVLEPGRRALGFGVGREPIPAVLAARGLQVLATDQADEDADHWKDTNEHAADLDALSRPGIVDDAVLAERVTFRAMDMNDLDDDLGEFDLVWSSCAIEHLGSPAAGLEFVLRTAELLRPGGVAVHTTEFELTSREATADYGHCAVYRGDDFEALARHLTDRGFEIDLNLYVSMATPVDRFVAVPPYPASDPAHLKLQIFDSVSTSYGLALRRR